MLIYENLTADRPRAYNSCMRPAGLWRWNIVMEEDDMSKTFMEAVKDRRSCYAIDKAVKLSEAEIQHLVEEAILYTPTAFNSQGARVLVLFGEAHERLWKLTLEALRKLVPAESFASTQEKINSFNNGYGTVLFFEEKKVTEGLQEQYPAYAHNFPTWAQQANAIGQFIVWTALEEAGLGASLQHYNELIEAEVKRIWSLPDSWDMVAQLPFGNPTAAPDDKAFAPIGERVRVIRA